MRYIIGVLISVLLVSTPLMADEPPVIDYSDNIGFMKNVPSDLREPFPMCDEFLDVNWIREKHDEAIVGEVLVDMYKYDQKKQHKLIFMFERSDLKFFDIRSNYHGEEIDDMVEAADRVSIEYHDGGGPNLLVEKNGKKIVLYRRIAHYTRHLVRISPEGSKHNSFTNFTRTVCLPAPRGEGAWVVEREMPYMLDSVAASEKANYRQLKKMLGMEYPQIMQDMDKLGKSATFSCDTILEKNRVYQADVDGDGLLEYLFWLRFNFGVVVFLNDTKPFLMQWPNTCSNPDYKWGRLIYYDLNGKKKEEQCVAMKKKQYLQDLKNE